MEKKDSEFFWSKKLDKTLKMNRLFIQLSLPNSESIFFLSLNRVSRHGIDFGLDKITTCKGDGFGENRGGGN